jgi:hypothetical protein
VTLCALSSVSSASWALGLGLCLTWTTETQGPLSEEALASPDTPQSCLLLDLLPFCLVSFLFFKNFFSTLFFRVLADQTTLLFSQKRDLQEGLHLSFLASHGPCVLPGPPSPTSSPTPRPSPPHSPGLSSTLPHNAFSGYPFFLDSQRSLKDIPVPSMAS